MVLIARSDESKDKPFECRRPHVRPLLLEQRVRRSLQEKREVVRTKMAGDVNSHG